MANSQSDLPEGTDSIIAGSSAQDVASEGSGFARDTVSSNRGATGGASAKLEDAAAKVGDATAGLRAQAADKAYDYAAQGKERAIGLLDNVTRLVDDAAKQIDEKAGEQFGNYARQASQAVAGFADQLRDKDVDELLNDTRVLVRKSPAIAIGAAAAAGFLIARVLKVGLSEGGTTTAYGGASGDRTERDTAYAAPVPTSVVTPSTATTVPVDSSY